MTKKPLISKAINDFYTQTSEEERLSYGLGPLEFERNKHLIHASLPEKPCRIIDIGGGTGKYSEWLAAMGHEVWMIDPVEKHCRLARKRASQSQNNFNVVLGEARRLDFQDDFADLVILHGPLYHLQEKKERKKAILEAKRITKPGGSILGFAINYTASTLVALMQGAIHDEGIFEMCLGELTSGLHSAPVSMPGILAEAYYHRPEELHSEFDEAGLSKLEISAVEGIIWLDKNYFSSRGNEMKNNKLVELIKLTENDNNLLALSPHMMIAANKLLKK